MQSANAANVVSIFVFLIFSKTFSAISKHFRGRRITEEDISYFRVSGLIIYDEFFDIICFSCGTQIGKILEEALRNQLQKIIRETRLG